MSDQNYLWTSLNTPFQLHVDHGWESSPEGVYMKSVRKNYEKNKMQLLKHYLQAHKLLKGNQINDVTGPFICY
jgi:hypothetical protein